MRAVNVIARAEISNWRALAATTPESLVALRRIGRETVEEILSVAIREWASAYLREDENDAQSLESARRRRPPAPGAPAAGVTLRDLASAFEELERAPGFEVLKRRQLDPGTPPSLAVVAAEQGVSKQRARQLRETAQRRLEKQLRDRNWPIRVATEEVRERLGALARTDELDGVFAAIDPNGAALPATLPHRRAFLLRLADFRIRGEWVLDPDIESLTHVVLSAMVDRSRPISTRSAVISPGSECARRCSCGGSSASGVFGSSTASSYGWPRDDQRLSGGGA